MTDEANEWGFALGLPSDFMLLPLEVIQAREGEDEAVADAASAAVHEVIRVRLTDDDPGLSATPEELWQILWDFTIAAMDFGALEGAVQLIDLPDGRYTATVWVYRGKLTSQAADHPGPPAARAEVLARQLREPHLGDVTSRVVEVVELPPGTAVRASYRADDEGGAQAPGTASMVLEVLQHWFPIDGQPAALVVESRTASLAQIVAGGFAEDHDRIAAAIAIYRP